MNEYKFTSAARRAMAIIAVLFAIFILVFGYLLIQNTLERLMEVIVTRIPENPNLELTPIFLSTWFIILRGISMAAAVTLIVIAYPLYKGEPWTWPLALSCISLPTIFGVLTSLPFVVQFGKPPPAGIVLLVGLVAFWTFLMLKQGSRLQKTARFVVFTLLGIVPGHINVLVMHGIKNLIDRPGSPLFIDPMYTIYGYGTPMNAVALIMCIVAIPLLAAGKKSGWWLGLIAGVMVVIANYPTHIVRMQTSDFMVAGTLGLLLSIALLIPAFKNAVLAD